MVNIVYRDMTTIHINALQTNLTYQSHAIFELASKGLIDLNVAKQAVIMVNKLREVNKIIADNHGSDIIAHDIKDKVQWASLEEIYKLL